MKKIKYFFIRQYAKIIRFLITFSSVIALIFAQTFSASAVTYFDCVYAQPQLTGKNCYLEIVTSKNWRWLVCVQLDAFSDATNISDVGFNAFISDNYLCIGTTAHIPSSMLLSGFRVDMVSGIMTAFEHAEAGNPGDVVRTWIGSAGSITGIHGYNCDVYDSTISATATKNDFVVNYGSDVSFRSYLRSISSYISSISMDVASIKTAVNTINTNLVNIFNQDKSFFGSTNMDEILQAIKDNKSSAENNEYTSPDTSNASQYESAESQLMDTTSSGRSSAVDTMKGIGGILDNHVGKSLLATSKLMSEFLGIDWLGDIAHFALVCGLFAFVLGISVMIIGSFGNWHVASRHADVDYNSHRKRLGK